MSMLLRPVRPLLISAARVASRSAASAAPRPTAARFVSGYGANPPQGKDAPADSAPGAVNPEYSGPSIAEKQKGGPVKQKDRGQSEQSTPASTSTDAQQRSKAKGKRDFHTSAFRSSPADRSAEELKEDAKRMKDSAANSIKKGVLKAKEVGVDLKEGVQGALHKAKKVARNVKETVKDAAAVASETVKDVAAVASTPVYPADKADLYPTSDAANAKGFKLPGSPEVAAAASGASLGKDTSSVKKSILDGPQAMPQGVGKRAKNEKGQPMEQGTRDS